MTGLHQSLDEQIRFAIENKRLLEITYLGKRRIVEPHDYGVQKRVERLFVYQLRTVSPPSSDRRTIGWRLLDVPKIEHCVVLNETFPGSRGRDHKNHMTWDILYARVR
jgi:hypothetical protein